MTRRRPEGGEYAGVVPGTRPRFARVGVVVAAVAAPFLTILVVVVSKGHWFPGGDMAQAELHMRGFFGHPPLVGAAGRIVDDAGFQGSHPGPSPWFAMLPVYLLGGRSSAALMAAVVSVHLASGFAAMWLARRRFGWSGVLVVAFVIVLIVRSAGPDLVVEPWNPWLALLPFLVFVFVVDEIIHHDGSWRWAVAAVMIGSHCVQCHAGYALVVGLAFVVLLIVFLRARKYDAVGAGVGALGVMWIGPLVDQFRREPGNLEILIDHFGSTDEPAIAVVDALRIVATQFNVIGPWILGPGPSHPAETWARWPGFVLFVVLVGLARRRAVKTGDREIAGLLLTVVVGILLACVSISRLFGSYLEYTIRWTWILAALATVLSGLALLRSRRAPSVRRGLGSSVWVAGLVVVSMFASVSGAADAKMPGAIDSRIVGALVPQLERHIGDATVLIRLSDPYTLDATGFGTVLELERRGHEIRVEPRYAAAALPHRTASERDVDQVWWFMVGPVDEEAVAAPGIERLAHVDPRSPGDEAEATALLAAIEERLIETGRDDLVAQSNPAGAAVLFAYPPVAPDIVDLLTDFYRLGQPVGVYVIPEGLDPESLR